MPILRYTASADTTITDAFKPYTSNRSYFANMGAADSLELFCIPHSGSSPEKARILINFPINQIIADRESGKIPAEGQVNFVFKLYNVKHPETLPKNYEVVVRPLAGSWDEGYGLDLENYTNIGQTQNGGYGVGWKFRSVTDAPYVWSSDGGDFYEGYDKIFHFDDGTEDLEVDVTDIIEDQMAEVITQDGLAVMLTDTYESGLTNTLYYTKRFSARSSEYYYKVPVLEVRWESAVKDDRSDFYFVSPNLSDEDNEQSLYFYNKFNGLLKDLPNNIVPLVKVEDIDGNILAEDVQSERLSTGTYRVKLLLESEKDLEIVDTWYDETNIYFKGNADGKIREFSDTQTDEEYVFALTNLKNSYKNYEFPVIRVFGRQKNWSPNIYKVSNNDINVLTFKNLYYKVFRIVDNMTIIDYGISPIPYTKCSYDKNGNYFNLDMSFFEPGYAYGVKLMLLNGDIKAELPNVYRFKVE